MPEKHWYEGDKKLYGMDGPTALGFCFAQPCPKGIDWALELPMGEDFVTWLVDENGMPQLHGLLSATYDEHFKGRKHRGLGWNEFAHFIELMSNRRWMPGPEMCELMVLTQQAKLA